MSQGITFDTANGIDLKGWWSNPRTGESYRVVDQFFQDNVLYVKTDKGQILNYNVIQNMVKSDGPLAGPIPSHQTQQTNQNMERESLLLEGLVEEDIDILTRPVNARKETPKEDPKKSVNQVILEKAFSKAPEPPKVTMGIQWEWPSMVATIEMLTQTMDVPIEEIVDYVYNRYIDSMTGDIKDTLAEFLESGGLVGC